MSEEDEGSPEPAKSRLQELWEQTGNPVYAWIAFAELCSIQQAAIEAGVQSSGLVLPKWCITYFEECASSIVALASGTSLEDFHDHPSKYPRKTWRERVAAMPTVRKTVSIKDAMQSLKNALGFPRDGANFFSDFRKDGTNIEIARLMLENRNAGGAHRDGLDAVKAKVIRREQSVLEKRAARGASLLGRRVTRKT